MNFRCPVCLFAGLQYPPRDYHICPCCGTEFGNDDAERTFEELREDWLFRGANWFFGSPPINWDPWLQLSLGGVNVKDSLFQTRVSGQRAMSSDRRKIA